MAMVANLRTNTECHEYRKNGGQQLIDLDLFLHKALMKESTAVPKL